VQFCNSSRRRNWQTSSPSSARFLKLLPSIGRDEVSTSLTVRPLIDDLCRTQSGARNHRHRLTRRGETPSKLFPDLADIVVHPRFPFRFLLRRRSEQYAKTLEFGENVFNIRVVGREVSAVDDDDGGGGGLRRLHAALPRGWGVAP
jgi:hypothetical protein